MTDQIFVTDQNFDTLRKAMVESQLRTTAVNDPRVVAAMAAVPRERFVPQDAAFRAYADGAVPLGAGRAMPAAMVLGRLLTEARTLPSDRALVIGAGSGYAAAVLAELVAHVVALEEDGDLAAIGGSAVGGAVTSVSGPLTAGWASAAPYDLILFDGAVEQIPAAIVDQLADGGRLAVPLLTEGVVRLSIGRKAGAGFGLSSIIEASCPTLPGFARPVGFIF